MTRYFVPICLYPHTRYRTRCGLEDLFDKFQLGRHESLLVVADRLLALDRLVTGRYWIAENVFRKARSEAESVLRLVRKVARAQGAAALSEVVMWDEIAGREDYAALAAALEQRIEENPGMSAQLDRFVRRYLDRFGSAADPARARAAEREYLLSEISMSVFCTEVLGFSTEVWERPNPKETPDPLRALYADYAFLISEVTGAAPLRTLGYLYEHETSTKPGAAA